MLACMLAARERRLEGVIARHPHARVLVDIEELAGAELLVSNRRFAGGASLTERSPSGLVVGPPSTWRRDGDGRRMEAIAEAAVARRHRSFGGERIARGTKALADGVRHDRAALRRLSAGVERDGRSRAARAAARSRRRVERRRNGVAREGRAGRAFELEPVERRVDLGLQRAAVFTAGAALDWARHRGREPRPHVVERRRGQRRRRRTRGLRRRRDRPSSYAR